MEEKKNNEVGSGALREALEAVINERDTELDMMHCQWGSREYQIAWHDGVEQARKRFEIVKKRAAEALALSLSSPIEPEQASGTHVCPVCQNHQPHDHSELVEKGLPMALAIGSFSSLHSVAAILGKMREDYEKAAAGPQAASEIREALADAFLAHRDNTMNAIDDYEGSGTKDSLYALIDAVFMPLLAPSRQGAGDNPDHYGLDRPRQGATK